MYKKDLALNNLDWLMCHKTKPNQTKSYILIYMYKEDLALNNGWYAIKPNTAKSYVLNIYI